MVRFELTISPLEGDGVAVSLHQRVSVEGVEPPVV